MFQQTKRKLVILISNAGSGTNLKAIIDGVNSEKINAEISAVISNTKDAKGLEYARENNLRIEICEKKEDLLPLLEKINPKKDSMYVCLAGWKQIITNEVILTFPNKILNLHPGLIPDTITGEPCVKNPDGTNALWNRGMLANKAIANFLDKKATFAGSSVHFLTLNFDFGPVLGKAFEKIEITDNIESLYDRLKKKENQLYVEVLKELTNYKT